MKYVNRYINNNELRFLEIGELDTPDEVLLYKDENNIALGMNMLNYLTYFDNIENLILLPGFLQTSNLFFLYEIKSIKTMIIDYEETTPLTNYSIDLSHFMQLEYLFSKSSENYHNLDKCKSLRSLIVVNWYSTDMASINNSCIDSLCILKGKTKSLSGIEKTNLSILVLNNLPLISISQINDLKYLKILEINQCNKIVDIHCLNNTNLEYLICLGKNALPNIGFISKLTSLKRMIIDMPILNGDLSNLDQLEHCVLLTDRKHYNRYNKQLPKSNTTYSINNIPTWRYYYSNRFI